jgi:glycosyltransferase involved in cell wall biosynthesis
MAKPTSSLQISTYNWPAALKLVLQSVLQQKLHPDELVIADDGSGPETKALVDAFAAKAPFQVKHVWHEDKGYCLPAIQNKAIAQSSGQYIIQVDGDCILHPLFVEDHMRLAKPNTFVGGTRGMIDEELTKELLLKGILPDPLTFTGHLSKKFNTVYNRPLAALHYWFQRGRKNYLYVKGCNMAFWKSDLEKVNGHNELFIGWGKEDNDLALRLLNAGVGIRFAKFSAIQYHLHHGDSDRSRRHISEAILAETVATGLVFTPHGIIKSNITPSEKLPV